MFLGSIAKKIFWGYVTVILLAVALSLYAIVRLQAMSELTASILRTDLDLITQVRRLRGDLLAQVRSEKQFGVTADPDYMTLARKKGAEIRSRTRMLLDRKLAPRLKRPLAFFTDQHGDYEQTLELLAAKGKSGTGRSGLRSDAADIKARLSGYFDSMRGQLADLLSAVEAQANQRTAESDAMARRASQVLLGLCVAAGAAALLIAWLMARHIGRPLKALRGGTFRVAQGDFDHPVPDSGDDELAHLARSFNRMADRLRSLDQTKAEFFSAISHELRTPLTSVREAHQLMLDGIPGPLTAGQSKLLEIAREGNDNILRLIDDLLKLAKLEADMMKLNLSLWRMEALIDGAVEEIRPIAIQASVGLQKEVDENLPLMKVDGVKIQGVLTNLLSNAVKFTPPGGAVRVRAGLRRGSASADGGARGRVLRVSVSDTGTGIAGEDLERIFDKFYRAEDAGSRQGSGLGLPIAKRMVEAHGGRIWAESETADPDGPEGGARRPGSTFNFEIPVEEAPASGENSRPRTEPLSASGAPREHGGGDSPSQA
ncbi:MAG: ATP-binding protein [Nitrospinota bacterium]|jgi:two-component system sensor histidine kinase GlrK|nr:ATP-binding protein [Nitrospinota bacterium]HJM43441.1 ATP-binding protein [Nitrospinota bacterium]